MKKNKLLLAAAALMLGGSVWAQTDVTSTYITNAGFEGDSQQFLKINSDGRGVQKPVGWSVEWTQGSSNGHNGMTYVGSMNQDGQNWTAYEGEKAYFTRMRWESSTLNLRQTMVNLPKGDYTLSFYATASKLSDGNGSASVSVAGQSQTINVGTSATTDWTQYTISFTVSTNPYATIEVTASRTAGNFKFGIDNFTLTYDGSSYYSTILAAAQSLYDDNADWATGADDLSAAITAAAGKETVADKNAAIFTLEEAMATFKEANTIDVTSLITNATFDSNISGWTTSGSDGTFQYQSSSQNNFTGGFFESWRNGWNGSYNHKNFDVSQTLSNLPNGEYTVKAAIIAVMQGSMESKTSGTWEYQNMKHGGPYYIDDEKGVWLYGTSGENSGKAWANTKNSAFDGNGAEYKTATVKVENGSLTIGFKGIGSASGGTSLGTYANWIACDNWTLSYFGFDPTTLKTQISDLKDDVQDLIDGDEVTTAVKTSLQNTLDNLVETPETKTILEEAVSTLETAISSANAIKDSYGEYKALKAQVEDLKNTSKYTFTGDDALSTFNSTLSDINDDAEAATDAATLTALLPSLKTAGNTFVSAIDSNDGFDVTYNIVNNSFETGALSPWTTNGSNDTGVKENSNGTYTTTGVDGSYLFNTWNNGAGSKVSQTLSGLPNGYYTVTALVASDAGNTISILAGATTKAVNADGTNGKNLFVEGTTDKTLVSDGSLEIGTNSATWYKSDYFRLTYYTVMAGAAEAWTAAKDAAVAARDNAEYANVAGSEKTNLLAEIAKAEPSTAEAYGTATTALQEATSAFIAAKDSYDALAAKRTEASAYTTVAWPYASTAKKTALDNAVAAAPTNAEDAVIKTNDITTAIRQFVESNGLAEGVDVAVDKTSLLLVYDANVSESGWTSGSIGTNSGQSYTMGNGSTVSKYFDGGWSTNAGANITLTQDLTLPAGQYQLQITARGSASLTSYTMSIGDESVDLPKVGDNGGTFGRGWSDKYVVFESDGTSLTLTITAASTEYQQWISFNRLRLIKLDATLATAEDYENLNNAIADAEANLGFEDGEYAPYSNTTAMALLLAAKAIDQTVNNVQGDVQDATTALTEATWTANDGAVDIVFNGMFTTSQPGDRPLAWTRSSNWGQLQSEVEGTYSTAFYNQPGSISYGNDGVYTMPLPANTAYKLTFSYRSHENNSNNKMTASVLNGEDGLPTTNFAANGSTSEWKTASAYFVTGAAGNYVLTLGNGGNTWMTNVSLVKENIAFDESDEVLPTFAAGTYPEVTMTRTIKADKWNTFCVPFDMTEEEIADKLGENAEVKELTDATLNGDNYTLTFSDADEIEAGKPYMVKVENAISSISLTDKTISSSNTPTTVGGVTFTGVYTNGLAPRGSFIISNNYFYNVDSDVALKAFRGYITVGSGSSVKALNYVFDDDADGISTIENGQLTIDNAPIFNLAGQRIQKMQKGINIVNGKKILR